MAHGGRKAVARRPRGGYRVGVYAATARATTAACAFDAHDEKMTSARKPEPQSSMSCQLAPSHGWSL